MRKVPIFAFAAAIAFLAVSGASHADDKKTLKDLEGEYLIIGIEGGGLKLTEEDLKKFGKDEERVITIKGDQILAKFGKKDDPATIKIDSSKTPNQIDITSTKDGKKETNYGIFKVEKDVLTIIATEKGEEKDRPKDFKGSEKTLMLTLKKQK